MKPQTIAYRMLFGLFMALFMGALISFVMVGVNSGFTDGFVSRWARGFCIGFIVAYPTGLICAPISQWLTSRILKRKAGKNTSKADVAGL